MGYVIIHASEHFYFATQIQIYSITNVLIAMELYKLAETEVSLIYISINHIYFILPI